MAMVEGLAPASFRSVEQLLGGRRVLGARSHSTLDTLGLGRIEHGVFA